ncbi:MAG: Asp-tRNA(Asn)/Glu-tRNA(Gln) amidotransferase subunit GatA [Chloroflexi bacterium]|nr:Asp-tRNA(Asn)/Glu-tRNA(Gln) amidotransferase subunit GatA [Chloroflexota bacterium]
MELYELSIHEALEGLRSRQFSSVKLTQAVLERIAQIEPKTQAYLCVAQEQALSSAEEADRRRAAGADATLLGIPLAIKDIICTEGIPTTCGSRILQGFVPPYDATVIRKLRQAGAVILGKTNTDEFAMGSSTENSGYFTSHNPWDLERVPGGSSGGSAAAVCANECLGALGSDTGGSIRQPASLCGIAGLKPTYGRVSRYGVVAYASSLDQVGTLGKDVRDNALLLQVIAGHDPEDSTSADKAVPDYQASLLPDLKGITLGVPHEFFGEGIQTEVEQSIRQALDVMRSLGACIIEVSLPHTRYSLPVYYLISTAEASANLARYDGIRYGATDEQAREIWEAYRRTREEGFGAEVKRRIMLGTYALSAGYYDAYYLKAQKARTLIKQDYDRAFQECQALITPTTPTPAFRIGEKVNDPLAMYMEDICTLSLNLSGNCGISIPCGFVNGLPVGLQILGNAFDEVTILHVAHAYEQATAWHLQKPAL